MQATPKQHSLHSFPSRRPPPPPPPPPPQPSNLKKTRRNKLLCSSRQDSHHSSWICIRISSSAMWRITAAVQLLAVMLPIISVCIAAPTVPVIVVHDGIHQGHTPLVDGSIISCFSNQSSHILVNVTPSPPPSFHWRLTASVNQSGVTYAPPSPADVGPLHLQR
jgi:hypothetical protein